MSLAIVDRLARRLYGWTPARARELGCCIRCLLTVGPAALSDVDAHEYALSALCPACFDLATREEET